LTQAWVSKGEKLTDNVYEGQQNGLVKCMSTIYKGVRSTSVCFLDDKPNITIIAETEVKRILAKDGRAYAAECIDNKGKALTISAKKEVILSAGVFHSPKLLMLSGIGPQEHLKSFGIDCVVDSPHVGQNLLDHPIFPHVFKLKEGTGLDGHLLRAGPMKDAAVRAYTRDHTGPLHSGLLELVGFPRIDKRLEKIPAYVAAKKANGGLDPFGPDGQPHFEIDFVPVFADAFQWHIPAPSDNSDHLTVIVDLLRPVSKPGEVKLRSADYKVQPYINLNFMENDLDIIALREGVRFVDDILKTGDGMKAVIGADYPWPMPRASDGAMNQTILERLQTGFHPCGTCRLSQNVGQGVVDPNLKVHGIDGLRVIDASVFPVIPDCRIQNVVYMVAEKGADMIKADYPDLYT
jgi:choline dehydrogenase-like flavoprotein